MVESKNVILELVRLVVVLAVACDEGVLLIGEALVDRVVLELGASDMVFDGGGVLMSVLLVVVLLESDVAGSEVD